jgi:NAD(P)-dependent dehydrogenase (short-subunit alcohol dehydrogenase family)
MVRHSGRMGTWTRALVTGASSGIGLEIARQLAADGTALVIVARNGPRLQELADSVQVECEVLIADLADPTELSYVEDRLRDLSRPVDLLVNNAGFGFQGAFHELDLEREAAVGPCGWADDGDIRSRWDSERLVDGWLCWLARHRYVRGDQSVRDLVQRGDPHRA